MIQPKEIVINDKIFILSKFTAIAGREIVAKYPLSGLPKVGDYKVNEETMLKLMSFVAIPQDGGRAPLRLTTAALVDNHVGDWEILAQIEIAMIGYNCSFFQNGRVSSFLNDIIQNLPQWTSKMLMDFWQQLSQTEKLPSTN